MSVLTVQFKPNEIPIPRHTLQDDFDEGTQPEPLPQIQVEITDSTSIEKVIIVPEVLGAVIDQFPQKRVVGSIVVSYSQQLAESGVAEDDFDEEEQLYSAIKFQQRYSAAEIAIHELVEGTIAIVVPHFTHIIVNNILSKALAETLDPQIWVTFAPCPLENLRSSSKLSINLQSYTRLPKDVSLIPDLGPPHCFTGISASVNSAVSENEKSLLISIALNAEGQPGFEKIGHLAQVEAAKIIGSFAYVDGKSKLETEYLKNLSTRLRRLMANSDYGMYL